VIACEAVFLCSHRKHVSFRGRAGLVSPASYSLGPDQTVDQIVDAWPGHVPDLLLSDVVAANERERPARFGDDVGAATARKERAAVGDVLGRDFEPGPHRRPNRLAVRRSVTASARIVACQISCSAGDPGRVTTSATSPCGIHRNEASNTTGLVPRTRRETNRA